MRAPQSSGFARFLGQLRGEETAACPALPPHRGRAQVTGGGDGQRLTSGHHRCCHFAAIQRHRSPALGRCHLRLCGGPTGSWKPWSAGTGCRSQRQRRALPGVRLGSPQSSACSESVGGKSPATPAVGGHYARGARLPPDSAFTPLDRSFSTRRYRSVRGPTRRQLDPGAGYRGPRPVRRSSIAVRSSIDDSASGSGRVAQRGGGRRHCSLRDQPPEADQLGTSPSGAGTASTPPALKRSRRTRVAPPARCRVSTGVKTRM